MNKDNKIKCCDKCSNLKMGIVCFKCACPCHKKQEGKITCADVGKECKYLLSGICFICGSHSSQKKECCEKCESPIGKCMISGCPCHEPKEKICPVCKMYLPRGTGHSHSLEEVKAFKKMFEPKECKHEWRIESNMTPEHNVCAKCGMVEPKETEWEKRLYQQCKDDCLDEIDYIHILRFIRQLLSQREAEIKKELVEWVQKNMLVEIPLTKKLKDFIQSL